MPKRKRSITPVERMIVVAILGILVSIILPNLQRTQKRARITRAGRSTPAVARHAPGTAGQLNTIEVSETDRRTPKTSPEAAARLISALLRLVIVAAVVLIVIAAIRQGRIKRAEQ